MKKITLITIIILTALLLMYCLEIKEIKVYRVVSSSMEPEIKMGSLVLISKCREYGVKDIVSYKTYQNETPVTHRIMKISKTHDKYFFTMKGDKNENEDLYPISQDEIIGKVILEVPFLGDLPKIFLSYKFIGLTVYLPAGIFIGKSIGKILKES